MAFEQKQPSIRATLTIEEYNKLIKLLTETGNITVEEIKEKGIEIKNKLLKYSNSVDGKVQTRFYPSQVEIILYLLLANSKQVEVTEDYYKLLVENKEKYNKERALEEAN